MNAISQGILETLAYADVFDYPLTAKEIWKYLISDKKTDFTAIQKELTRSNKLIGRQNKYLFLRGRKEIVAVRGRRERRSQKKLEIARRVADWLKIIPTIKMVGITGALAMKNSGKDDDIDFLIVTARNRLWLTRLLTVFLVGLVAKRRRPGNPPVGGQVRDKICLNMFLDEGHLALPKKERDLFLAHEVAQLKPIWDKNGIYKQFISQNIWSKKFLANWSA